MKKIKNRFLIPLVFVSGMALAFVLWFSYSYCYRMGEDFDSSPYEKQLSELARECLDSNDVPVAALLLYKGKVIGAGKNDIAKNQNASGHAEINAITDCLQHIAYRRFQTLDKKQLILLTTYEPCPMCRGAIQEYGIGKTVFNLPKRSRDKLIEVRNQMHYYWNLRQTKNKQLQYDLFRLDPDFDTIAYPRPN